MVFNACSASEVTYLGSRFSARSKQQRSGFRGERNIDCPSRRSRTLSLRSVSGQRVNSGVEEVRILKVSLVAWLLVWNWLQSCRQRLVPLRGERRDIGVHSVHLFDGHIAGEWNRIEPGTAYGRVSKQGVNVVSRLGPPLRHQLVFHDRQHQYGIDKKSTRLNSSHLGISYAVFCL